VYYRLIATGLGCLQVVLAVLTHPKFW
jgi:hypothetical protein